jgi:hypothetical protein
VGRTLALLLELELVAPLELQLVVLLERVLELVVM